jgi:hypothetical protein
MKRKNDPKAPDAPSPAPRRRFSIERLEERIAPAKGGNGTKNCGGGGGPY